ncbi:MAG: hypothetical protein IPF54_02460 [Draconibacterium sp.]|nr:hypothetical protein [Draconibacterium sp.]
MTDFENEIARINVSDKQEIEIPVNLKCSNYNFEPYFVHTYQFGEKAFSISYEDKFLENWLHPIIDHLNSEPVEILSFHFEVFNCGKIVFAKSPPVITKSIQLTIFFNSLPINYLINQITTGY